MSWIFLRPGTGGDRRFGGFVKMVSGIALIPSFFCLIVFDNFLAWLPDGDTSRITVDVLISFFLADICFISSLIRLAAAAAFTLIACPH